MKIYFILMAIVFFMAIFEIKYQSIKKYYPTISRIEYFILSEKLIITPERGEAA